MNSAIKKAILLLVSNGYSVHKVPAASVTTEPESAPDRNSPLNSEAMTVNQFITRFKVGRTKAYEEIASGRIATYKVGRRRYISARAAAEWQAAAEGCAL